LLTLSKIVVEIGNRADAARAGDYRLESAAAPEAFARADYQLEAEQAERAVQRPSSSLWLGPQDALARFGVRRGEAIEREQLIAVLQGQHVQTGEQLRRPGSLKREARDENGEALLDEQGRPVIEKVTGVAHVEMTLSVPKSVSVLWAMADDRDRVLIENALLGAAERTVQYMARNKAVVHRRGQDGARVREPAAAAAVASSLHVTARRARGDRAPAPQLHVHNLVIGVTRTDGKLVAADSWEWFRHDAALEGGAVFRNQVADALVQAGWAVRSGTGDRRRYFEVLGVPEALCEVFSPRSREVADARARVERELGVRLQGGALAVLAKETRQAKDHDLDPSRLREVWDALAEEHDFGPGAGSRLRRHDDARALDDRFVEVQDVVLEQLREQGPTVTLARARALVFEAAAGRLSAEEASRLLARMECPRGGDLLLLAGGRVTSREIRELEQRVMAVAARAAGREGTGEALVAADREAGVEAAERALGEGRQLDREQRSAVAVLCGAAGWVCLTGRAGTGKGPALHAAAEAYRHRGWQVRAVAMDGTTARRMAEQLGGSVPALTVEQLKVRAAAGALALDDRTVIFVDEASKLDSGHWGEIANLVEQHGVRVRAVGHDGQHEAIKLPGLFSEMLHDPQIPAAELRQIRRHRDPEDPARVHPWLRDYQVAVDQGHGSDAVALLQRHDAIKLYDTRAQAMGGMVAEWDSWRDRSDPGQSALIVHGPNSDVDLVNELAQQRRLEAGELGTEAVPAVDRSYLLRPGDVVAIRDAAYTFPPRPDGLRPKRVENGQIAVIDAVDAEKDTVRVLVREPGAQPRLVEIDQARLRAEHAVGKRAAAVRLAYAMHSFPAQGATVQGTATLAGHWSQAKRETYVGDTRAIYRHTVHVAREDLGVDGTDEDRIGRYAQRIAENRQRLASIRSALDPTLTLVPDLPAQEPIPGLASVQPCRTELPAPARASSDTSPGSASRAEHETSRAASTDRPQNAELGGPPDRFVQQAGPRPEERIARERWEREAGRLKALHGDRSHPASRDQPPGNPSSPQPMRPSAPSPPRQPAPAHGGPKIGR
jgi:conjugative relaxase-like TrwC/TraI family protein